MIVETHQLIIKEVFSPHLQLKKFRRERIKPLCKDEILTDDLFDKSFPSKYNNYYKFILTVVDLITEYTWLFH